MGRSRGIPRPGNDDQNHRSKRRKTGAVAAQTAGTASAATGMISVNSSPLCFFIVVTYTNPSPIYQETGKSSIYHCNYCSKDISGVVRMKCAVCSDFDLCVECFCVGAELFPHKSIHPYRIMDNLSFPLITPDWNADEEMLLLEGIGMYGFGNWAEVAEHVGLKSKQECIDHYTAVYMNSPCFPLPDMSHIRGKSREELLAMAKERDANTKKPSVFEELILKDESSFGSKIKSEESTPKHEAIDSPFSAVGGHTGSSSSKTFPSAMKKASTAAQLKDTIKVEESQADRSVSEKKPRGLAEEGPSLTELSGYNFKRQEFEVEYDNDAEQLLADMEFKDNDTDYERQLKLQVLHIYGKRLDERKRRKEFILERNLLYPDPFEKSLSTEEKELYKRYKVFMRFQSKEEHLELMKNVIDEYRIAKRIKELQEARAAGCLTAAEANQFIEAKKMKEVEERTKETTQGAPSGKGLQKSSDQLKEEVDGSSLGGAGKSPTGSQPAIPDVLNKWDISGLPGADLLSELERQLCNEMQILPAHYLKMLQIISTEVLKGSVKKKSDAHSLFKVEPSKVDRVYDMLVKKGIAQG
ncbi:Transcriptional adapter ADA2 [Linum perenne]